MLGLTKPRPIHFGITETVNQSMQSYISTHQDEWAVELATTRKLSKFIRHSESGQLFSMEFWQDWVCLIYPKDCFAMFEGTAKKLMYAVDLKRDVVYARLKPFFSEEDESSHKYMKVQRLKNEARVIDSLADLPCIVQNFRSSSYLDKRYNEEKFHIIQELYDANLKNFQRIIRGFNRGQLEKITLDLSAVLSKLHERGIVHGDVQVYNVLCKINGFSIDYAFCDFEVGGEFLQVSREDPDFKEVVKRDAADFLEMVEELYTEQNELAPNIIGRLLDTVHDTNSVFVDQCLLETLITHCHMNAS